MNLRQQMAATALVLSQAFPAAAQDGNQPYIVSRECAVKSLRDTFGSKFEIMNEETGVVGFITVEHGNASGIILMDPSGVINSIDTQLNAVGADTDINSRAVLSYETGEGRMEVITDGASKRLDDWAVSFVKSLDQKLRECAGPSRLSSLARPFAPHIG